MLKILTSWVKTTCDTKVLLVKLFVDMVITEGEEIFMRSWQRIDLGSKSS